MGGVKRARDEKGINLLWGREGRKAGEPTKLAMMIYSTR